MMGYDEGRKKANPHGVVKNDTENQSIDASRLIFIMLRDLGCHSVCDFLLAIVWLSMVLAPSSRHDSPRNRLFSFHEEALVAWSSICDD